jgi:hypothetical protein
MSTNNVLNIKIIQPARCEEEIVRHVMPEATHEQVTASTSSCVVHLCGCK